MAEQKDLATADDQRVKLIQALEVAQRKMASVRFTRALRSGTATDRDVAGKAILDTMFAREALKAAVIGDIANAVEREQADIEAGIERLDTALQDLQKIAPVLEGITALLKVAARIVAFV